MAMRTLGIRHLSAPAIAAAADRSEVLGITNGRVFAGVLVPCSVGEVRSWLAGNAPRVLRNIDRGEREIASIGSGEYSSGPDVSPDSTGSGGGGAPVGSLGYPGMRTATLREINGRLLEDAAAHNETIAVTTDRVMAGIIIPVTQSWLAYLVEQNLPRILDRISRGEAEISTRNIPDHSPG